MKTGLEVRWGWFCLVWCGMEEAEVLKLDRLNIHEIVTWVSP
jgi:hypothetical protein